jgi:hypothetical protein
MHRQINEDDFEIVNGKKVLKDGRKLTVGLAMMDSLDEVQRAVANKTRITDAQGGTGLHRPGFRVSKAFPRDQSIYDSYEQMKAAEFKCDVTGAAIGHQEGDSCTKNGNRGTMHLIEGKWTCVPNNSATDAKAEAYAIYDYDLVNAWRTDGKKTRRLNAAGQEEGTWEEEDETA